MCCARFAVLVSAALRRRLFAAEAAPTLGRLVVNGYSANCAD